MNYEENLTYDWLKQLNEDSPIEPPAASYDAATAIVNRALITAKVNNWSYGLAKPPADLPVGAPAVSDCTGFVMWCWGANPLKHMSDVSTRVTYPEPGAAFWWDPQPGHKYGHAGIIVAVHGNDFDTVDCGESAKGVRYKQNSKGFWSAAGSAGSYENLQFWRPSTMPPNPGNPESFEGSGTSQGSSGQYGDWKTPFKKFLDNIGIKDTQRTSLSEWKEYRKIIRESVIKDFVRGRNAIGAQDVGALDVQFTDVGDARGNIKLDPSWVSSNIVTVQLSPGNNIQFNKKYANDLVVAYQRACRLTGYCPKQNGGWVPRRSLSSVAKNQPVEQRDIGGHAWGTSFDLLVDKSNPKAIEFANELKKGNPDTGTTFIWGGDWEETGEETHFEVNFSGKAPVTTAVGGGLSGEMSDSTSTDGSSYQEYGDWRTPFKKFLGNVGINEAQTAHLPESRIRIGKKFIVVNKSKNKDIEKNKKILFSMLKYYDDKLQFDLPVKIIFKDDRDNSQKPLGKTGYYHPEETSITIFTTNRLLKDILRSLGHELIHHKQHCIHPFENHKTPEGYAQVDKRLRRKEKEAYLFGNMLFRDFEDNYKTKHKGVF